MQGAAARELMQLKSTVPTSVADTWSHDMRDADSRVWRRVSRELPLNAFQRLSFFPVAIPNVPRFPRLWTALALMSRLPRGGGSLRMRPTRPSKPVTAPLASLLPKPKLIIEERLVHRFPMTDALFCGPMSTSPPAPIWQGQAAQNLPSMSRTPLSLTKGRSKVLLARKLIQI